LRRRRIACVLSALLGSATTARANIIVLDSCVQQCSDDDVRDFKLVREALAGYRVASDPDSITHVYLHSWDIVDAFEPGTPLPAAADPGLAPEELTEELTRGLSDWASGRNEEAEQELGVAIRKARANPELVLSNPAMRNLVQRSIIGRSVSLERLADERRHASTSAPNPTDKARLDTEARRFEDDARSTMEELVCNTNEQSILDTRGPEADKVFQDSRHALGARGKGSLVAQIDDESALFWLSVTSEPHKSLFSSDELACRFRLFVRDPQDRKLRIDTVVQPGRQTLADIHWTHDLANQLIATRPGAIGFVYPSDADRIHEPERVRDIGTASPQTSIVVVLAHVPWHGSEGVAAVIYDARSGHVWRSEIASMEEPKDGARQLAAALLGANAEHSLVTRIARAPWDSVPVDTQATSGREIWPWYGLGWTFAGSGLVGAGIGIAITGDETDRHTMYVLGGTALAIGLVTTSLYLFLPHEKRQVSIAALPTRDGFFGSVGWSF
jgi:hypothetical protein